MSDIPTFEPDSDDLPATAAIEQFGARLKRLEQFAVSVAELLEGIAEIGKEPGAWVSRLAEGRRQAKLSRSLLAQIAAERAAVAEGAAKAIAEAEEQKKSAARMWARAAERERVVEAREQAVGEREVTKRSPQYPDADPTFIPMAGSDFTRSLPRPLPSVDSEPPAEPSRRGTAPESFPPGVTLTRSPEEPAGARVRGRRGAATAGA
jgi:hypothetical protein